MSPLPYRLRSAAILAGLCAAVVSGCTDVPVDPGTQAMSEMEQATHRRINEYRITRGLAPLRFDETIAAEARAHSRDMAAGRVAFSHDGFDARVEAISVNTMVTAAAENVAFNTGFADPTINAVDGWLNSDGHRMNIEGDYSITGIGVEKNARGEFYFTQIFVK